MANNFFKHEGYQVGKSKDRGNMIDTELKTLLPQSQKK